MEDDELPGGGIRSGTYLMRRQREFTDGLGQDPGQKTRGQVTGDTRPTPEPVGACTIEDKDGAGKSELELLHFTYRSGALTITDGSVAGPASLNSLMLSHSEIGFQDRDLRYSHY